MKGHWNGAKGFALSFYDTWVIRVLSPHEVFMERAERSDAWTPVGQTGRLVLPWTTVTHPENFFRGVHLQLAGNGVHLEHE